MPDEESQHAGSGRRGKAAEHLVAAGCILGSNGDLNALTALVDDEGVDIVFNRRGRSRTVAVQVKSRFWGAKSLSSKSRFITDVRSETFRPRSDLYLLFVAVDASKVEIDPLWLIPSEAFAQRAPCNVRGLHRFSASAKPDSADQWSSYRLAFLDLPQRLMDILGEI